MSLVRVALVLVPLVLLLGIVSAVASGSSPANPWFAALAKPAATPPGWAFPLAWVILYILIGFALSIVVAARRAPGRTLAIGLFVAQFVCNLAWSPAFFAAHQPAIAFALILLMIVLTIACLLAFARVRRGAALLMLPYLAWLCFAAYLNHGIDVLNPSASALAPSHASTQIRL